MKRKAIEKIEPAKTRKKGHIATVQTLDDIAIINVFNDKVLAVRYCINCKTGEHEYWTENNGWKKGKLITAIEGNWYEWVWMKHAYKYPKIDSEEQVYQVYDTLEAHEYIVIDSRKKTIIKRLANGTEQNIFYKKATGNSIFTEIPSGDILINWSGEFGFDIVVYKERSVPEWISSKQINTEGRSAMSRVRI